MIVRLFRSEECPASLLRDVVNLLNDFPGPIKFTEEQEVRQFTSFQASPENPFRKTKMVFHSMKTSEMSRVNFERRHRARQTVSWEDIFRMCTELRLQHDIGVQEFVVLLMGYNNDLNWFAAGSMDKQRNFFIHASDWDFFIGSDQRFPVAYQVASGILKKLAFSDSRQLASHWHQDPRGCMLDFCADKEEVSLKMRTADICPDCFALFENQKVQPVVMHQVLQIFDGIREQMLFKSRFRIRGKIPVLHIRGRMYDLVVPEMGQLGIPLDPIEKTLYLFYLRHPEGVAISHLSDYQTELMDWYLRLSSSENREQMQRTIRDLTNPLSNSASEKLSRMKGKFIHALGREIAGHFLLKGGKGQPRKIDLSRDLVIFEDN